MIPMLAHCLLTHWVAPAVNRWQIRRQRMARGTYACSSLRRISFSFVKHSTSEGLAFLLRVLTATRPWSALSFTDFTTPCAPLPNTLDFCFDSDSKSRRSRLLLRCDLSSSVVVILPAKRVNLYNPLKCNHDLIATFSAGQPSIEFSVA